MGHLSDMPEDILYLICSSLIHKQVIRLSISSKEILRTLRKRPTLVFDGDSDSDSGVKRDISSRQKKYREEGDSMLSILVRYQEENIDLDSFTFHSDRRFCSSTDDKCIELAAKKRLRKLCLSMARQFSPKKISLESEQSLPTLPGAVFQVGSLVQVELKCYSLQQGRIPWHNLKHLSLRWVAFPGGEGTLEDIILGCPLIEILELDRCCHTNSNFSFKIGNPRNLKELTATLVYNQTVEVNAVPNLESLYLNLIQGPEYQNLGASSLRLPEPEYQNLTGLTLEGHMRIDDDFFVHLAYKFPKLEDLCIERNRWLHQIHVSSPSVKKLRLIGVSGLQEARFDVPRIALFEYENDNASKRRIIPKLSFTGNTSGWISHISFIWDAYIETGWFVELSNFLTALNGSQTSLAVCFEEDVDVTFDAAQMRDSVPSPTIREIRDFFVQIKLKQEEPFPFSSARAILDGIFWICRPQTVRCHYDRSDFEFPKLFPKLLFDWLRSGSDRKIEVWDVTGVDIFQGLKRVRGLELPQITNSDEFLEILKAQEDRRLAIGFKLEWRIPEMAKKKQNH